MLTALVSLVFAVSSPATLTITAWSAPSAVFCAQIYCGPETALVRGTFRRRSEYARFSQKDGCAIARWNRVSFLFR